MADEVILRLGLSPGEDFWRGYARVPGIDPWYFATGLTPWDALLGALRKLLNA